MLLYRPVGLEELCLMYEADMRAFPPRLPDQPIFYPVLNEPYAAKIARDWNTKAGTKAGFVTRFSVADGYGKRFEHQVVGSREYTELWVPAEELSDFNAHIDGTIEVIGAFFGKGYRGQIGLGRVLGGRDAADQLAALVEIIEHGDPVLVSVLAEDHTAVFLNFPFWETLDALRVGVTAKSRDLCLETVEAVWNGIGRGSAPLGTKRVPASAPSETQAEVSEPPTPGRDDLTAVGYWISDHEPDLPDPRTLVGSPYNPDLRSRICTYLESGSRTGSSHDPSSFPSLSYCTPATLASMTRCTSSGTLLRKSYPLCRSISSTDVT
jgi:hypothetical protein